VGQKLPLPIAKGHIAYTAACSYRSSRDLYPFLWNLLTDQDDDDDDGDDDDDCRERLQR